MGTSNCEAKYGNPRPPVPYGQQQNVSEALWFEDGFKECVGYLTEGRYLVFEMFGHALTNLGHGFPAVVPTRATPSHDDKKQRWVVHYWGGEESGMFTISSALDGRWLGPFGTLLPADSQARAAPVRISFLGNGKGYSLQYAHVTESSFIGIKGNGSLSLENGLGFEGFKVWSVTYHN